MLKCVHYDTSDNFAFQVGLLGKSRPEIGIIAIVHKVMSLCVWSLFLYIKGYSLIRTKALELFTTKKGLML